MTFDEMVLTMRNEFESDARRLQVHLTLRQLKIDKIIEQKEEVSDDSEALNWLVKFINKLTPQCPEGFKSEENKIQYLRDAVVARDWASLPISQVTSSKYAFNYFVSTLRKALQFSDERKLHEISSKTHFQQYGREPKSVKKFGNRYGTRNVAMTHLENGPRAKLNPLGKDKRRMKCHLCGSENHFMRNCKKGSARDFARERLAAGVLLVHILAEIVDQVDISSDENAQDQYMSTDEHEKDLDHEENDSSS